MKKLIILMLLSVAVSTKANYFSNRHVLSKNAIEVSITKKTYVYILSSYNSSIDIRDIFKKHSKPYTMVFSRISGADVMFVTER